MSKQGKYNKQMLEELYRRRPELRYDLDIIAEKLDPEEWQGITDDGKRSMREYFEERLNSFETREEIEETIQHNIKYNTPEFIHELSDSVLIHRMINKMEAPQGYAYIKWLTLKYSPGHSAWQHPDHDLDLTLDEARKKYNNIYDIKWLVW